MEALNRGLRFYGTVFIGLTVLTAILAVAALGAKGLLVTAIGIGAVLGFLALMTVCIVGTLGAGMAGTGLVARALGLNVFRVVLGPFVWARTVYGWRRETMPGWTGNLAGQVEAVPSAITAPAWRLNLALAAQPLIAAALGLLGWCLMAQVTGDGLAASVLKLLWMNLGIAGTVVCLVTAAARNSQSALWSDEPDTRVPGAVEAFRRAHLHIEAAFVSGARPRDWPSETLDALLQNGVTPHTRSWARALFYLRALDRGELAEASEWLDAAMADMPDPTDHRFWDSLALESAYLAVRQGNGEQARERFDLHSARMPDLEIVRARARCALATVEGDADEAQTQREAHAKLVDEAGKGLRLLPALEAELDWVAALFDAAEPETEPA